MLIPSFPRGVEQCFNVSAAPRMVDDKNEVVELVLGKYAAGDSDNDITFEDGVACDSEMFSETGVHILDGS